MVEEEDKDTDSEMRAGRLMRAEELFRRVVELMDMAGDDRAVACRMMHETLVLVCHEGTAGTNQAFGNLFSQVAFVCGRYHLSVNDTMAVQRMRRDSNRSDIADDALADGCRALAVLIAAVYEAHIPHFLLSRIPAVYSRRMATSAIDYRCLRGIVVSIDATVMKVEADIAGEDTMLDIDIGNEDQDYLVRIARKGMQLNLVGVRAKEGDRKRMTADYIIVEPDYLVDISSIARCFTDYGHSPLAYIVTRMQPVANTEAILLGNLAGALLDDTMAGSLKCDWRQTLKRNFREKALEYCACTDLNRKTPFHEAAEMQARNIMQAAEELFGQKGEYDGDRAMLEPSFVCEILGIQGRVDLMTTDFRLLVEQKSGSNWNIQRNTPNGYGSFQKEDHYVQLLLYYGVLRYNFNLAANATDIRLLYSRYPLPGGLVVVNFYRRLFAEALKFRNRAVALDFLIAHEGFGKVLPLLVPERLNENNVDGKLWRDYVMPQLHRVLMPLHNLSETEKAYLCRMMTFCFREQVSRKVGAQEGVGNSMADLWNMPLAAKMETGNIYCSLEMTDIRKSNPQGGYDMVTLHVPDYGNDFLPNFRQGDMVWLYAYRRQPDVRNAILFKGVMAEMSPDSIVIHLNNPQHNVDHLCICPPSPDNSRHDASAPVLYAVEHCGSDAPLASSMRSLHQFACATTEARDLLMGKREPAADLSQKLSKAYNPCYDDIVLKAKQAQDYFLLVGPPGTGKTSMALHFLVEEELDDLQAAILLMAYTNRAVDEICGMLTDNGYDFVRIGNEFTCDPRYRSHLLSKQLDDSPTLADIKKLMASARIVVATTSTMQSRSYIFGIKAFSLLVVDEASQILEPDIIGLLCSARRPGNMVHAVGSSTKMAKFILIGDHKQLPAVVQQDASESVVTDTLLLQTGLTDCRNSLFERLLHIERRCSRTAFTGILRRYGRLHPEIAAFPNHAFYRKEDLMPVPLPHQKEDAPWQRMVFIPSADSGQPQLSDKVNSEEARIVAHLLHDTWLQYGSSFDPAKTVGVIVPYRNQIAMIRRELAKFNIPQLMQVCVDTVERYQGSQRDVIIYATTIRHLYQLDFLTANTFMEDGDIIDRKLNVAITRARMRLYIIGNESVLRHNTLYARLIDATKTTENPYSPVFGI